MMITYETMMAVSMLAIMAFVFTECICAIRQSEGGNIVDMVWVGLIAAVAGISMIGWTTYIFTQ